MRCKFIWLPGENIAAVLVDLCNIRLYNKLKLKRTMLTRKRAHSGTKIKKCTIEKILNLMHQFHEGNSNWANFPDYQTLGAATNVAKVVSFILTYRSQLFSHIFRPKTRVRPIRWSYLSENFHQVGTKAKLIGYCVHALVHAHTKTTNGTRSCTSNYCLCNQTTLSSAHAALQ